MYIIFITVTSNSPLAFSVAWSPLQLKHKMLHRKINGLNGWNTQNCHCTHSSVGVKWKEWTYCSNIESRNGRWHRKVCLGKQQPSITWHHYQTELCSCAPSFHAISEALSQLNLELQSSTHWRYGTILYPLWQYRTISDSLSRMSCPFVYKNKTHRQRFLFVAKVELRSYVTRWLGRTRIIAG